MHRYSWSLAACALAASTVLAQQPAPRATEEGFFRPAADPAINAAPAPRVPEAVNAGRPAPLPPDVASAVASQVEAREALERELDRARRENARVQADAVRRPPPLIASPLEGTAPIVSPLDR
jgi:hypothetical protein